MTTNSEQNGGTNKVHFYESNKNEVDRGNLLFSEQMETNSFNSTGFGPVPSIGHLHPAAIMNQNSESQKSRSPKR